VTPATANCRNCACAPRSVSPIPGAVEDKDQKPRTDHHCDRELPLANLAVRGVGADDRERQSWAGAVVAPDIIARNGGIGRRPARRKAALGLVVQHRDELGAIVGRLRGSRRRPYLFRAPDLFDPLFSFYTARALLRTRSTAPSVNPRERRHAGSFSCRCRLPCRPVRSAAWKCHSPGKSSLPHLRCCRSRSSAPWRGTDTAAWCAALVGSDYRSRT
jgi:hypothetical protein